MNNVTKKQLRTSLFAVGEKYLLSIFLLFTRTKTTFVRKHHNLTQAEKGYILYMQFHF